MGSVLVGVGLEKSWHVEKRTTARHCNNITSLRVCMQSVIVLAGP